MRPIDADAAMKKLGGECIAKYPNTFTMGRLAAVREIDDMPTIEQPQWISCAERLPTEAGFYRVCHESGTIADRYFYGDCELFTKFGSDPVTHWKPIEEPPKGG